MTTHIQLKLQFKAMPGEAIEVYADLAAAYKRMALLMDVFDNIVITVTQVEVR